MVYSSHLGLVVCGCAGVAGAWACPCFLLPAWCLLQLQAWPCACLHLQQLLGLVGDVILVLAVPNVLGVLDVFQSLSVWIWVCGENVLMHCLPTAVVPLFVSCAFDSTELPGDYELCACAWPHGPGGKLPPSFALVLSRWFPFSLAATCNTSGLRPMILYWAWSDKNRYLLGHLAYIPMMRLVVHHTTILRVLTLIP